MPRQGPLCRVGVVARQLGVNACASGQPVLSGCVALVTGASRGIGKGCALALAEAGCVVYITGRAKSDGSLEKAVADVTSAAQAAGNGGQCIGCVCDHTSEEDTEAIFAQIDRAHAGRLDVLVNNAYDLGNYPKKGRHWWEREHMLHYDTAMNVGLRGHYMCSLFAARRMTQRRHGLIVSISGPGGMMPETHSNDGKPYRPSHRSIAYVMAKTATDRMMADMAADLRSFGVTAVSMWPGGVLTERVASQSNIDAMRASGRFESPQFIGRAVAALAGDKSVIDKAGKVVMPHELALEYGFTDVDGSIPKDSLNMWPLRGAMSKPPPWWVPDWRGYKAP